MIDHKPLFKRPPETLEGYTPHFSEEQTLLGYQWERVKLGGGFKSFDDDGERFEERHSITVCGVKIVGKNYYSPRMNKFEVAAQIANEFLANEENRKRHEEVFAFFRIHAENLNNSKRYWQAWNHLQEIQRARDKMECLKREIERAEIIASVNALSVKLQKSFSQQERDIYLAEFSGGAFSEDTN